jgi:hypothetical protein
MENKILFKLCQQYIRGTAKDAIVLSKRAFLCHLTHSVIRGCSFVDGSVYINTRMLKHMYDKKPAEEFDFMINNMHKVIKYPNDVYKNKDGKRGNFCFAKELDGIKYLCAIEIQKNGRELEVATAFRIRKENYLNDYKLLWSWRDDAPSS